LQRGQPIGRDAASETLDRKFGWSTLAGVTLVRVTTGYVKGQATPAGRSIHAWLDSLGATAGSG
jgi:hypothetical protein